MSGTGVFHGTAATLTRPTQDSLTLAISFLTVFDGWAPLAIHDRALSRTIFTVGG